MRNVFVILGVAATLIVSGGCESVARQTAIGQQVLRAKEIKREKGRRQEEYSIGLMYALGDGVPQDYEQAFKWFIKAADQGHAGAQCNLGSMYDSGMGVPQDYKQAFKWYTKAADQGYAEAQCNLGLMYSLGEGFPQDYKPAVKWYTKAADQGYAKAQYNLAVMYRKGQGVPQDYKKAVKWYTKAAKYGVVEAQHSLALMYYSGDGVPQDYKEAFKWCTKAADQGDAGAQAVLGSMYYLGDGVPQNSKEAVKWYIKAADQGHAVAQYLLGEEYYEGQGVPQDYKQAVKWYIKAANQGYAGAQCNLGRMYYKGEGVLEDYVEAYKWFLLAAMNGNSSAQDEKDLLLNKMTPVQIEQAQQRARDFVAKTNKSPRSNNRRAENISSTATGFLITSDGFIITASHSVPKTGRVAVRHKGKQYPARVVIQDPPMDIAVLKIDSSDFPCLPIVSSTNVKAGHSVFTVGYPQVRLQGTEPKYTEGSISSLSGLADDPRHFQISVPIQPGNSGGPLVNEKGEVVGVLVSKLDDVAALMATGSVPQNVNYALKSSFVLPFLESVPGLPEKIAKAPSVKDKSAAIDRTKRSIVLVLGY